MSDTEHDAEKLTRIYIKMRDAKDAAAAEFKQKDEKIKSDMAVVARMLMDILDKNNTAGMTTQFGSVTKIVKERFWSTDWEAMKGFAVANADIGGMDLFEQRLAQKNIAAFLKEHPDLQPEGLQVDRKYDVRVVRKNPKPE